jgi:hypothetical protein
MTPDFYQFERYEFWQALISANQVYDGVGKML